MTGLRLYYRSIPILGSFFLLFATLPTHAAERSDLNGVWLLTNSDTPEELHLTRRGQAALESYEPLVDDADNYCIPVSFTNIMHTPSPPFEIRVHNEFIEINYEYMDVRRRVPLDPNLELADAPYTVAEYPHLGRSVGRFENEILIIDTAGQEAGVLDTLGVPGLPQSAQMRTEERFIPNGDELEVVIRHEDPINYSEDLIVTYGFHRLDSEIMEWGCEPEAASYDRFLEQE